MATIVTRSGKGSPLTNNEVDANFTNLNTELGTKANTSSLATVATTGAYADLTGKPTIASADGSVVVTGTTNIDLSVAVAGSTSNVVLPIRNTTGATLAKGTAVYISGATGQISTVSKAIATGDATSAQTLGLVTANIANNSSGNVTLIGTITNIDTSAYTDGQQLYLSPTTAGTLTATKPYAPQHLVYVAVVEHAHPSQGKLFVKVQNGYEMDELHDVSAQNPANNDGLFYNTSTSLWEKKSIPTALGYTPYNATNPAGYITGITSGNVTTALGYTPANRAGDTFTGPITVNSGANQAILGSDGAIELTRGAGGAYIDFKDSTAEDFDVRLQASGSQLNISAAGGLTLNGAGVLTGITSGQVTTALGYTPYNATNPAGYITSAGSISGNAATATNISNTGTVTLASATESNSIYATAPSYTADQPTKLLNFDWYGNVFSLGNIRSGSTPSSGFGVYYTPSGGSRAEFMRIDTSGSVLINRTSASGIGKLNVEGGVDVTSGNVTVQAGYGIAWRGDQSRIMTPDDNSYGALIRWGATGGCRLFESTTERLRIDGTGSVTAFVDVRAPIFYDSNNTNRYLDPSSTSVLTTVEAYGSGFRSLVNGSASISSQLYFANAANTRAWNWQLDENDAAALWSYGGSSWGKRLGLTHNSELFLRNSSGSDVSLAYPSTFGYSSSYKTMVLGNQSLTTVCIGVSPASNPSGSFNGGGLGLEVMFRNGVNFITPNSANNGYHFPLSLADGYTASSGSFRAPIFYDSENTAYYVDPHSTSVLLNLNLNGGLTTNGSITVGNGAASSDIYMADSDEGTRRIHCNSNRIGFLTQAEGWGSYCSDNGDWTTEATGYASSSFRAPIFYDTQDTNNYVDPNSHSNIWRLTASNRSMVGSAQISMSGLDANTYYPVTIPLPVARQTTLRIENALNSNAPSWSTHGSGFSCYIEWTSNGLGWGTIGLSRRITDWREQFASVQIVGGIDQMTFSSQEVIWLRGGANYFFSADCDVTPTVRTTSYDAYGQVVAPRSTVFNDPWETAVGKMSYGTFQANVRITAGTDIRAPIFYDSNDTSRFVDPTGVSTVNILNTAGYIQTYNGGVKWDESGTRSWSMYPSGGAINLNSGDGGGSFTVGLTGGTRAPIFYDTNDTSYYADPNGTSVLNAVHTWGEVGMRRGDSGTLLRSYNTSAGQATQFYVNHNLGEVEIGNARGIVYAGGSYWQIANSVRAPIMYDSNNTAFYVDPATGSSFSGATFSDLITGRNSPSTDVNTANDTGSISIRGSTTTVAAMSFHRTAAYAINMGLGVDNVFRIGGWSAQSNCLQVYGSGAVQALNDFRAPIFYDSNDTGYYLDPHDTSFTNGMRANVYRSLYGGGQPAARWDTSFYVLQSQHWYSHNGTSTMYVGESGDFVYIRGYTTADGSSRAPIFYDNQNTGYYVDPSSTGTSLNVAGNIDCIARSAAWAEGVRVRVPSRSTWGGIRFTRDEGNANGNWAIGFTGIDSTDDLTFWGNLNGGEGMRARLTQTGNFTATGNVTAYSDARLKEDVATITNALDLVGKMRGVTYTRKDTGEAGVGVIAQEMREIMPQVVLQDGGEDGTLSVAYGNLVGVLIEAIKELRDEVEMLRK